VNRTETHARKHSRIGSEAQEGELFDGQREKSKRKRRQDSDKGSGPISGEPCHRRNVVQGNKAIGGEKRLISPVEVGLKGKGRVSWGGDGVGAGSLSP